MSAGAWGWLKAAVPAVLATACLDTPPDYQPPDLRAPLIQSLSPYRGEIQDIFPSVRNNNEYEFEVFFELAPDEDPDELFVGAFVNLLASDNRNSAFGKRLSGSGYDSTSQSVRSTISLGAVGEGAATQLGCNTYTMILTWQSNVDNDSFPLPIDREEAVELTWWLKLNPESGAEFVPVALGACPGADGSEL